MSQDLRPFWIDTNRSAVEAGWCEQALPEGFACLVGGPEAEPIVMESRAWSGPPFRTVRTTWMYSPARIEVFNLVAYPWTSYAAPNFATDIVLLKGQMRIAVVDAMPVRSAADDPAYADRWVEPFMELQRESVAQFPRFELRQEWSQHYLGPAACLATGIGVERLAEVHMLWQRYWGGYLARARQETPASPPVARAVSAFHRQYNRDHAEVEIKRNPLMRYYGAEVGTRFIREFLFADEDPWPAQ